MTMQDYLPKVYAFVAQYNEQSNSPSGFYRLQLQVVGNTFDLRPEAGDSIMWPEQIFQFAHENGWGIILSAEFIDDEAQPVVSIWPRH